MFGMQSSLKSISVCVHDFPASFRLLRWGSLFFYLRRLRCSKFSLGKSFIIDDAIENVLSCVCAQSELFLLFFPPSCCSILSILHKKYSFDCYSRRFHFISICCCTFCVTLHPAFCFLSLLLPLCWNLMRCLCESFEWINSLNSKFGIWCIIMKVFGEI